MSPSLARLATLAVCLLAAPSALAQVNGAIYTTDKLANVQNTFKSKDAVYMAGGPGPNSGCSGNGLPDGTYVFQVTDPSGSVLLSSDPIAQRGVLVSGGVVSATVAGGHTTRSGPCGSRIVQLQPFADSPSSSGEYKVWFTPIGLYAPGQGFHGFTASASKTTNFKIRSGQPVAQTLIHGTVLYDLDEDGAFDPPGEMPLAGWKVTILSGGVLTQTFTDLDGGYAFLRDMDSATHVVTSVAPPPGFVGTPGGRWLATGSNPVPIVASVPDVQVDFGNLVFINTPELARSKGYWHTQGMAELAACDPAWRTAINDLCLRTNFSNPNGQAGTIFTVSTAASFETAFAALSEYLIAPANGVLANILSVQFCAANLNKTCGVLQITTYIDRLGDDVLVSLDSMIEATRALLCDPKSANTGPFGDPDWRAAIMGCLMEWVNMNSNGASIFTPDDGPGEYVSPY